MLQFLQFLKKTPQPCKDFFYESQVDPGNMITVESNYEDKIVKTISFSIKYLSIPISVQH